MIEQLALGFLLLVIVSKLRRMYLAALDRRRRNRIMRQVMLGMLTTNDARRALHLPVPEPAARYFASIADTSPKYRRVDPAMVAAALGAEPIPAPLHEYATKHGWPRR